MRKTILCAAATAFALYAAPAGAAQVFSPLAFKSADPSNVEAVQWRRGRHDRRWIGPAAGFAPGIGIGNVFAPRGYDDGYYGSYAYAPGYAPRRYRGYGYGSNSRYCTGEESADSAFPSWMCSGRRR